jgi:transcriptional regulator with XRE-family HTH domain
MAKSKERLKALKLRRKGESIKSIAKQLGVSVGSVSVWCRGVVLTEDQTKKLEQQGKDPFYGKRMEYAIARRKTLDAKINRLRTEGVRQVGALNSRELFLVGIALYWSEGFKKDSQAGFANSNPEMIKLFIKWLNESCGYTSDDLLLRLTINISHKHREEGIKEYWSHVTKVPVEVFGKTFYQNVKWQKIYENPNEYYGVLRVKVRRSTDFLRKIHGWIEGLSLQA